MNETWTYLGIWVAIVADDSIEEWWVAVNIFERRVALATVGIGAGGLLLGVVQTTKSSEAGSAPSKVTVEVVARPQESSGPPAKLPQIMTGDTIGRNLQYIESIIGKPLESDSKTGWRAYLVEGCRIELEADSENAVTTVAIEVTPSCPFEWGKMNINDRDLKSPSVINLDEFFRGESYNISRVEGCVRYCGNMADPLVTMTRFGSHSDNWVSVTVGVKIDSSREVAAGGRLSDYLAANVNPDVPDDLSSLCDSRVPKAMLSYLGGLKIERVEFSNRDSFGSSNHTGCDLTTLAN